MNHGRLIFAQLMEFFPRYRFGLIVEQWRGEYRVRRFSCYDQFLCMAYAQLTGRESLRDIETCLRAMAGKLYHAGFRATVARNTLAVANERRPWQIWEELAKLLIERARRLYVGEPLAVDLEQTIYALDSTTIDLCLALFPWASFRRTKGAVKLHTLLDLRGNLPTRVFVTHGRVADVNALDWIGVEPGAIYVFDRAYLDFKRLWRLNEGRAWFVTRTKKKFDFVRLASHPVDKSSGIQCDQTIRLGGVNVKKDYTGRLRRVRYLDPELGKRLVFLTNNFELPAHVIALLYKQRWQIELFFKWIKQHLRIKAFFGTTENAVKTQVWIAIAVYVLAAIVKKELHLEASLYTILQVLSVTLFEKTPILQALSQTEFPLDLDPDCEQLSLFDF